LVILDPKRNRPLCNTGHPAADLGQASARRAP
jgi:hypothetical protein